MLALIERNLAAVRNARTDADIADVLAGLSESLGFRSGYLIEFIGDLRDAVHIVDSSSQRVNWWEEYVAGGMRTTSTPMADLLAKGGVQHFNGSRFTRPNDPLLAFARKVDLVDCVLIPITYEGRIVGLTGFSGATVLTDTQQTALQLLVYALFAQTRSFRHSGITVAPPPLTPREKEVMALSADGLTSTEIAERLGMSARTVNQHVDNVADKLGTKNRAHTVAEVIRHDMLN